MTSPISFIQTNVLKAVILPFEDKELKKPLIQHLIVLPINPETYNESLNINLDQRVSAGKQHSDIGYISTAPQELKLDFILDGTGTVDGYANVLNLPVLGQIERLKIAVYDMDGKIHRPRFLKVIWGTLIFNGVLSSMDINYTLFNPLGIPIRAKISLTLVQHEDKTISLIKSILQSPDVTHERDLKGGQRLDQITNEIYNDPNLVLHVAKANNLTSFRNVKSGIKVIFPPIDKETS